MGLDRNRPTQYQLCFSEFILLNILVDAFHLLRFDFFFITCSKWRLQSSPKALKMAIYKIKQLCIPIIVYAQGRRQVISD